MQKWEYLVVEFLKPEKKGMGAPVAAQGAYRPRYVDGKAQQNWQEMPHFRDYLEQLGEQGWELAGNAPAYHGGYSCVFKRPKPA